MNTTQKTKVLTMEDLLTKSAQKIHKFRIGDKVSAKVVEILPRSVAFDIGAKTEAYVSGPYLDEARDYVKTLEPGDVIVAIVVESETSDGSVRLSLKQIASDSVWQRLEDIKSQNGDLDVVGKTASDRGVAVEFDTLTGFIPASQLGKDAQKNPESLVGKRFKVKVIECDKYKKRVVLSERAISEAGSIALSHEAVAKVVEGNIYQGVITQLTNFGVFVELSIDVDGKEIKIEGLVHISELSWEKVANPAEIYSVGEKVDVKVLGVKDNKISLSIKHAKKDPWTDIGDKYYTDKKLTGKVIRSSSFGTFVELEPGVEGLIHVTKIPPATKLTAGSEVSVYIEEVSAKEHKISLGLILTTKPVGYK